MSSKNTPAGSTTTTTNSAPWSAQQPYLEQQMGAAQNLYGTGGPQYYPGQTYSQPNPVENAALNTQAAMGLQGSPLDQPAASADASMMGGSANAGNGALGELGNLQAANFQLHSPAYDTLINQAQNGIGNDALSMMSPMAQGAYLNGGSQNPYTQALSQNVLSSVVPSIESQFVKGGDLSSPQAAYAASSGATNALAPSLFSNYQAQEGLQQNAASTLGSQELQGQGLQQGAATSATGAMNNAMQAQAQAASDMGNIYNAGMQNQLGAVALSPQTQQMPYADLSQALNAGATQQGMSQNELNSAIQQWNYNQTLPYQTLNQYIAQTSGNLGGTGSTSTPFYENTGANVASGLGSAALLSNAVRGKGGPGSAISSSGPGGNQDFSGGVGGSSKNIGSVLGAGALASSIFSDRRLKEDIRKIGEVPNGLAVYSFRYLDDPEVHIGFLADEVARVRPAAVRVGPLGLLMVDNAEAARDG